MSAEGGIRDRELTFKLYGENFSLTFVVTASELRAAGYTIEEVKDINSEQGLLNLLDDLGYKMHI